MKLDNQNLEWELCEAYFSILEMSMTSEVSLDQLSTISKISIEEIQKVVPNDSMKYRIFFLKKPSDIRYPYNPKIKPDAPIW